MTEVLLEWVRAHGAPGVFLLAMAENLGLPWITAPAYVVAAEIVRSGRIGFWQMVGLITAGHMVGATAAWSVMRVGNNALSHFFEHNEHLTEAHAWLCDWYARRGAVTLLIGRLVGQIRPWASLAAGMARVRALPFVLWTAIGSALYSAALLWLWLTGLRIWVNSPHLRWLVLIAVFIGLFGITGYLGVHILRRRAANSGDECAVQ